MSESITIDPAALQSINSALKTWDRAAAAAPVVEAERVRNEFVSSFPLEDWPTLPVSAYKLGIGARENLPKSLLEFGSNLILKR